MAYRGRGRGRGRGNGRGHRRPAKEEPFVSFPDIGELPKCNLKQKQKLIALVSWSNKLQKFWTSSPYYYEIMDVDSQRNGGVTRKAPLSDYMKMTDDYVPAELGARSVRHRNKEVRWDQSDLQRLDLFEKLDQRPQAQDEEDEKEKKEDEDEDEDNETLEDEDEDSGNDYDQNVDFDDDEDDFNMHVDRGGDKDGYY